MWDFSWLERRWAGAGYEDWDRALDELQERGYDAVRIDAYPHLVATDAAREWTLLPVWDQQVWGSPGVNRVRVQPALNEFIAKCAARGILVGLSTWYRQDEANTRMRITSPAVMAAQWLDTLASIARDGLLGSILWVDLCNEWPGPLWAPFFRNEPPEQTWGAWHTAASMGWMQAALAEVRREHPDLPLCFSFDGMQDEFYALRDLTGFDLIEHHTWMAKENGGEFAKLAGYTYGGFDPAGYRNLVAQGEALYQRRPKYWQGLLVRRIASLAAASVRAKKPLVTTECWGVVDYKDWPLLDWGWIKELCELGTLTAAATHRWAALATSNFCGPQFCGMWRDVAWHQRITAKIKSSTIAPSLAGGPLLRRLAAAPVTKSEPKAKVTRVRRVPAGR